jgi:hypothetical protein
MARGGLTERKNMAEEKVCVVCGVDSKQETEKKELIFLFSLFIRLERKEGRRRMNILFLNGNPSCCCMSISIPAIKGGR